MRRGLAAFAACLMLSGMPCSPAMATTVFTENFDGETASLSSSLGQFAVAGSVDVVASENPYGITVSGPASGNVLDINGTGAAGRITSFASFSFNAGDLVTLSFDLGGSQRGDPGDIFNTSFLFAGDTAYSNLAGGGLFSGLAGSGTSALLTNGVFVTGATPFTTSYVSFLAENAGALRFSFDSPSQDNVGPQLDNIGLNVSRFPSAPEPSTWALMLIGFGAIGFTMRRRRGMAGVGRA